MESIVLYIVIIVVAIPVMAWLIKKSLSHRKLCEKEMIKRKNEARERGRQAWERRERQRFEKWKALMGVALRQYDVDAAVVEVMNKAKAERGLAHSALVAVSGLTDEETKARRDAVFAGYEKAQQDMDCEVSAPVGLCMRPYKSVEENYQIGYRYVQAEGVPGKRVHINYSPGIGSLIDFDVLVASGDKNDKAN